MTKNVLNQKMNTTLKKKVIKMFNFAFLAPENSFTPKDLKKNFVFFFSASIINIAHAIFLIAAETKKTKYI